MTFVITPHDVFVALMVAFAVIGFVVLLADSRLKRSK